MKFEREINDYEDPPSRNMRDVKNCRLARFNCKSSFK